MTLLIDELINDTTVINFKQWWLATSADKDRDTLAILCFYDISELPSDVVSDMSFPLLDKMRLLSLISQSETSSELSYDTIKDKCMIDSDEELEHILIRAEQFVEMKIDSVERVVKVLEHKATRDIYNGEKLLPYQTPVRTKESLLTTLQKWSNSLTE